MTMITPETIHIPLRDGVKLATDLYRPSGDGPWPVILERTPYNKANAVEPASRLAEHGYVVAIQDVRGRNASPGEFYPFAYEGPDGYDTVEWLAAQPWCTGRVGTKGGSYNAADQGALGSLAPPHLAAMVVAYGPSSFFHSSMRHNGALELRFFIYVFNMAMEAATDPEVKAALDADIARLPELLRRPYKAGSTALRFLPTYEQWLLDIQNHTTFDDYWRQPGYGPLPHLEQHADVPVLWIGGWYDTYTRGTSENVTAFRSAKRSPQHLLIGPWQHCSDAASVAGKLDFGPEAVIDNIAVHLRWFDRWLRDIDNGVDREPGNRLFITGINQWRDSAAWPPTHHKGQPIKQVSWHLGPDLTLAAEPVMREAVYSIPFNADDPVPTHGGNLSAGGELLPPGALDQNEAPVAGREDILRFRSAPLAADLLMVGPLTATLWLRASKASADITVKLIDETPDGPAWNLTDSICRSADLLPEAAVPVTFSLFPVGHVFRAGHRVRIDVAASSFPRFDLNPAGSCQLWLETGGPCRSRLVCGGDRP